MLDSSINTDDFRLSAQSPASQNAADASAIDTRLRLLSAVVDLQIQLDACRGSVDAAQMVVDRVAETIDGVRVILAWRERRHCKIYADSRRIGSGNAGENRFAEAAAEEVIARTTTTVWPARRSENRHALLAVEQFAKSESLEQFCAEPLVDSAGEIGGVLMVCRSQEQNHQDNGGSFSDAALLQAIATPLACKLSSLQRIEPSRVQRWVATAENNLGRLRHRSTLWAFGVLLLVLLVPVRYKVRTDCEIQPVQRRFVAAPFDGPLQRVLVRPGDTVHEGDLLATINPREIEFELAGLQASLGRAVQEKKGLIAQQDFAASKIASLETQEAGTSNRTAPKHRRDNLEIRSPIDGVDRQRRLAPGRREHRLAKAKRFLKSLR